MDRSFWKTCDRVVPLLLTAIRVWTPLAYRLRKPTRKLSNERRSQEPRGERVRRRLLSGDESICRSNQENFMAYPHSKFDQSEITFAQLWKGDGLRARKEFDCFILKGKLKVGVVEDPHEYNESADEEKCFAVALCMYTELTCMIFLIKVQSQSSCPLSSFSVWIWC